MLTLLQFEELIEASLLPLNRFVRALVPNPADAEDIVQETVVKAFTHFDGFRGESKFKTWLLSIALNEVRSKRRKEFRSRLSYVERDQLEGVPSAAGHDSPWHECQQNETRRRLQKAVGSLSPKYQELIHLRTAEGLDIGAAARRLSISVPAAKARYQRAVVQLSHTLAPKRV
jgi:RNA polymerase sigma-70 factor (ECF subfamily)